MKKPLVLLFALLLPSLALSAGFSVTRHAFTREIVGREPMDDRQSFKTGDGVVYFFNQIVYDGPPKDISHVWKFNGEVVNEIPLRMEGPNWRTWSNTNISLRQAGEWTVEIKADGESVYSASFKADN